MECIDRAYSAGDGINTTRHRGKASVVLYSKHNMLPPLVAQIKHTTSNKREHDRLELSKRHFPVRLVAVCGDCGVAGSRF